MIEIPVPNFFAYDWPTLITLTAYAQLYVNEFKPLSLTNVNDAALNNLLISHGMSRICFQKALQAHLNSPKVKEFSQQHHNVPTSQEVATVCLGPMVLKQFCHIHL